MSTNTAITPARRRVGRPCSVCSLSPELREQTELALAAGTSIARISRQLGAPSRDALRRHIQGRHLPADLQQQIERAQGFDAMTLVGRISDIARRHRETALEARQASNHTAAIRAGDAELRALQTLAGMGIESERDVDDPAALRALSRAAIAAARTDPDIATTIAIELDALDRADLADQLVQDVSGNEDTND